ncbi:hypothetical protein OOZ51_00330 [Arthrobacter sp. MI7-26]|uniref:hypothetical protein n=1 Tax=Arthrobacter sp. MI7-26 TaxID=2993653 RepID=UPI0022490B8C|nr:hypothetical protein [Arthrobacter sp. MI7-26]MCX2746259.1 hypothetical protein [Arthrobacter sp. MI7-26]
MEAGRNSRRQSDRSATTTRIMAVGAMLIFVLGTCAMLSACSTPTTEITQQNSGDKLDPSLANEYGWLKSIKVDTVAVSKDPAYYEKWAQNLGVTTTYMNSEDYATWLAKFKSGSDDHSVPVDLKQDTNLSIYVNAVLENENLNPSELIKMKRSIAEHFLYGNGEIVTDQGWNTLEQNSTIMKFLSQAITQAPKNTVANVNINSFFLEGGAGLTVDYLDKSTGKIATSEPFSDNLPADLIQVATPGDPHVAGGFPNPNNELGLFFK